MKKFLFLFLTCSMLTTAAPAEELTLQPGNTVDITVYNSPELSGSFRIHTDGNIRMPLVGRIQAAGKTESELYDIVRAAVDTYVKNPHITLIPKFTVSILGNVTQPGTFTVTGSERVIEMIAQAGGFDSEASGKITLHRGGKTYKYSKKAVIANGPELGFLQPGDVVIAEKKTFSRSDYSLLISTISVLTVTSYYIFGRE